MNMKFGKRTLAALLAVMLFCALPMGALAGSHADHDSVTFTDAYSSGDISGDKYLDEDVSETDVTANSGNVHFCLNGHTLSCGSLEIDNHQLFLYDCVGGGTLDCDIIVKNTTGLFINDGISLGDVTVKGTSGSIKGVDDEATVSSITVEENYAVLAGKLSVGEITVASGASLTLDSTLALSGITTLYMDPDGTITNNGPTSLLEHLAPPTGYRFKENGSTVTLEPVPSLTVQSDPTAGGTAAIDSQTDTTIYPEANDKVKLIATPNAGYEFEGWYDYDASAASLSDASTYEYSFSGTKSVTLTAKFTPVLAVENILTNTDESTVQFTATYGGVATTITGVTALSSGAPSCSDDGTVDLTDVVPHDYEYEITCAEGAKTKAKLFVNGVTNVTSLTKEFDLGSVTSNAQVAFGTPAFTYSTDGSTWVDAVDAPGTWKVKVTVTEDAGNKIPALEYTYEITVKLPKPTVSADPETVKLTAGAGSSTLTAESTVSGVTYQWKKDGAEISGATSATLTENYSDADAGKSFQYTCVITLNGASTESDSVTVTVGKANTIGDVQISDLTYGETPAPSLTEQPTYGSAEFLYATSETGPYSATVPENAGTYYVKATVPAGTDYDAVETAPKKFTINKAFNTPPSVIVTDERVKGLKDGTIKDVTSAMEYKSESESGWHDCPDGILPNLAPGKYQVRYKETDNYLAGNPTKVMVKEGGGIPSDASFRFIYTPLNTLDPALNPFFSTLADLETDMLAKVKSQKMSNKAPTGTAYWDIEVLFRLKNEDGTFTLWHTVTGDLFPAQGFLITIPYETIATDVTASNTRFYAAHVFTYGDKAGTYEYPDVTNAAGGASLKVTGTSPLLLAYITEGGSGNTGKANTIGEVQISDLTYGETPAPSLTANPTYGTAEYVYATSETGPYSATVPENAGTYYVKATVPAGTDYDAVETDPVSFTINKASNTNLPDVTILRDERVKGLKDGAIQGVTSAMEYKSESESGWHDCPDGILPNRAPGKYQVRYKETDNYLAGIPKKVTVKEGGGIPSDASFRFIYTPLNTLDPALNPFFSTLADLQTDMLAKVKSQKMSSKAPTGTAYWDIVLEYCLKGDTVWHTVTGELFPAQGFLITIPYEKIATGVTASNTKFYAAHVFTYGDKTGTYEYPDVTNAAGGASLKVIGTSPLLLAYITEGGGNSGGNSGGIGSAVPTGDTNNPVLWGSLLGLSVLGCGAMVVVPKLKKKKEEKNT